MKIGILEADELVDEIKKRYGTYSDMFQRLLSSVDETLSFHSYQVTQFIYPSSINECDAYLLTGSKFGVYEDFEWIKKLESFVVELYQANKKLTGICFGHQLIAQALGGLTEKSKNGWGVGLFSSDIRRPVQHGDWFNPEKDSFILPVSHQDQVVHIPPRAMLVASSAFCPNAAFQIGDSVLTFQGHPEFSNEYLKYIINNRREDIGEEKRALALSTLIRAADRELVAQWLVNFIRA